MIYPESKKLDLIASLINESNNDVLMQVEKILAKPSLPASARFAGFENILTEDEFKSI